MSHTAFVSTSLLIVLSFAGCMGGGIGSREISAPDWKPGFLFAYVDEGSYRMVAEGTSDGDSSKNEESEKFGPIDRVFEVLNTTMGSPDEPAYLVAVSITDRTEEKPECGDEAVNRACRVTQRADIHLGGVRKRDLYTVGAGWSGSNCDQQACRLDAVRIEEAPADHVLLDFPLTSGKSWSYETDEIAGDFGGEDLEFKVTGKVAGKKTIETPLGKLSTIHVKFTFKPLNLDELRRDVREEAKEDGVDLQTFDLSIELSSDYYYSEEYQTIVRRENTYSQSLTIKGKDDGKPFSFSSETDFEGRMDISGARLVEHPEKDLEDIARILFGKVPLGDPTGAGVRPADYAVSVSVDKPTLNVGAEEAAHFTAAIVGTDGLPDGHKGRWRVLDAVGQVALKADGLDLTFKPAVPGSYTAEFEAVDETGNVTAADGAKLIANFQKTIVAKCPQAVVNNAMGQCDAVTVPVRHGIQRLDVSAKTSASAPLVNAGELRLRDLANRQVVDRTAENGVYQITMDEFNLEGIGNQDWSLALVFSRAVQPTLEYTIDLHYGEETPAEMVPQAVEAFVADWHAFEAPV